MNKFFATRAPLIIVINILLLHLAGFLSQKYFFAGSAWAVWSVVALIDAFFGYKCGIYIKTIYLDNLTGLYNRSFFPLLLDKVLSAARFKQSVSLLMLDIDNFKWINDNHGHLIGDKVLTRVAAILRANTRPGDYVVRWGGEEFAVVLPATAKESAMQIAERLREGVEMHDFDIPPLKLKVTVSIGVAWVNRYTSKEYLVNLADRALYKAKENKNAVIADG